jgi:hypothetical protein
VKLGCSYNLFDGEELLRDSVLSIRENVDYISIVYQTISNYGNECSPDLLDILLSLKDEDLVDDIIHFEADLNKPPHSNELLKRNIGLQKSREHNCTHHISMDVDEFYDIGQFAHLKEVIESQDLDSSACSLFTYYKNNYTILHPLEKYYVSMIFQIREGIDYKISEFPVLVDPTRRQLPGKFRLFPQDEIMMHHFSYVRKDFKRKLLNSSARENDDKNGVIEGMVFNYAIWQRGMDAVTHGLTVHGTKEIKPKFLKSWTF